MNHGTLNIERDQLLISQLGQHESLVRIKESNPINISGNVSVSADNSALIQTLGVTQEQIIRAQTELDSNLAAESPPEPTIIILSHQEYCFFRKYKRALESGLVMKESEAIKQNVIHTSQESVSRIFFSRSMFNDPDLTKGPPFARANKYRPTMDTETKTGKKRKHCYRESNTSIPVAFGSFQEDESWFMLGEKKWSKMT